jgi:hypothetical protein
MSGRQRPATLPPTSTRCTDRGRRRFGNNAREHRHAATAGRRPPLSHVRELTPTTRRQPQLGTSGPNRTSASKPQRGHCQVMSNSSLPERHRRQRWFVATVGVLLPFTLFLVFDDGDQSRTEAGPDLLREARRTTLSTVAARSGGDPEVAAVLPPASAVTAPVGAPEGDEARTAAAGPSGPRSPRVDQPVSPSDPVRIVIPAIAVDTSLVPIGLNPTSRWRRPTSGRPGGTRKDPGPGNRGQR